MDTVLNILRWITHKLSYFLAILVLGVALAILAVTLNVSDREVVKGWLEESNTYSNLLEETFGTLAQNGFSSESDDNVNVALEESFIDESELVNAAKTAVTPEFVQEQGEKLVDAYYDWLEGNSAAPEFEISFNNVEGDLIAAMSAELQNQLEAAPVCSQEQIIELANTEDILSYPCIPEGFDIPAQVMDYTSQLSGEDGPLSDLELSGEDLTTLQDGEEEPVHNREFLRNGPVAYSVISALPFLFAIVFLASSIIVILSAKTPLKGVKELGWGVLTTGIFSILIFFVMTQVSLPSDFTFAEDGLTQQEIDAVDNVATPLVATVIESIAAKGIFLGILATTLGAVMLGSYFILRKHFAPPESETHTADKPNMLTEDAQESTLIDAMERDAEQQKIAKASQPKKPKKIRKRPPRIQG